MERASSPLYCHKSRCSHHHIRIKRTDSDELATRLSVNSDSFWTFEHTAWERSTKSYEKFEDPLTAQTIDPLLSAVQVGDGMRLLDVATEGGNVVRAAAERGATVVGIDFSAVMLAEAQRQHPDLDLRAGNA